MLDDDVSVGKPQIKVWENLKELKDQFFSLQHLLSYKEILKEVET